MNIVHLSYYGFIQISGPEAGKFLQGQLTCEVLALKSGDSTLGACCNPQGRVVSVFRLFQKEDAYFLRLPQSILAETLAHLKKYAIFSKVQIVDVSDQWVAWGANQALLDFAAYAVPGLRFEYYLPAAQKLPGEEVLAENLWQLEDLKAGLAQLSPETSEQFTPHDLNLPALGAVSFSKGCYTGQEIVARMEYRGKLKQHLYLRSLPANALVKLGVELVSAAGPCGQVVDAVLVDQTWWFLALLKDEAKNEPILIETKRE